MGPYAVGVLIHAYFMESHPVGIYTDAKISYILVCYQRKSRDFCVGVWYIYDDGSPHIGIHFMVQ